MWLGVDYYPEQWDVSQMDADMDTILELGCNVIRIGEFSWHLMEKQEGEYDFSFFDRVIAKAKQKGLKVIMGTPTAAIPAWLAKLHPSILSEFEDGRKRAFGGRHVYCFLSPEMYEYSEKIIRRLVMHYRDEDAIIAWQIDNELGHEGSDVCYCPRCQKGFQRYLYETFDGDIDRLNDTYGTTFWSQEYNAFHEISTPMATITTHNPALRLDWERFRSRCICDFAEFQVKLIREILPYAVILHDFPGGGLYKHVDYSVIARQLDVVAYNNYPVWGGQREPLPPYRIAFGLDYMRGLKRKNIWITEAIMGAQGHDVVGYSPRPEQAKLWSFQGFAHGCDALLYFRYRGATKGAEQFCYGILDADNVKRRKFYEAQRCFAEVRAHESAFHTPIESKVAILYDYDSLAAFRIQRQSLLLDCPAEMARYYRPFYEKNIPVDVIPARMGPEGYEVVLLPQMLLQKPELAERVKQFASAGGTVILTYRTAVKDEHNNLVFGKRLPLEYDTFAGVSVVETESLQEGQEFPVVSDSGESGTGGIFREMLAVEDAEVLYRYGDDFYKEYAAVTRRACGKGEVYYLGCGLDDQTLAGILGRVIRVRGLAGEETEAGVEVVLRGTEKNRIRVIMNHNSHATPYRDTLLAPFESRIERV